MPAEVAANSSTFCKYVPFRYVFALLGSIGIAMVYGLNIFVLTMASMVHDANIPLARVAEKYSAKWVMFFSVAINVACTLLTLVLPKWHSVGLILMRVMEGIGGGASYPAMHVMIASWAPPTERMVMSTIIYLGTALSILIAGVLPEQWGWESVFYVMGALSCIWMVLWIILVQDNPNKQRFISPEERQMINSSLGTEVKEDHHPAVPWKKVFTSIPFWAILITHFCYELAHSTYTQDLDINFKESLFRLYYFIFIFSIGFSILLYCLQNKGKISATCARKITTSIFLIIPGACLIFLCCSGYHQNGAVTVISVGFMSLEALFPCFLSNHVDIAPNFAGTLVALTNSAATITNFLVSIFVGLVIAEKPIEVWRIIFGFKIAFFAITFLVFIIFGSGEEQSWNKKKKDENIAGRKQPT